jgi:hypothetical protein
MNIRISKRDRLGWKRSQNSRITVTKVDSAGGDEKERNRKEDVLTIMTPVILSRRVSSSKTTRQEEAQVTFDIARLTLPFKRMNGKFSERLRIDRL